MLSLSVPAWADDGDEPTAPATGTTKATMTGDGTTFTTANDNDAIAATATTPDTDGAQLYVWAQVRNSQTPTYKIDIEWGALMFEFVGEEGAWDPVNHTVTKPVGGAKWSTDDGKTEGAYVYLPATDTAAAIVNNEIQVTNHSNYPVKATFELGTLGTVFNDGGDMNPVVGNFFATAAAAQTAAKVLTSTGSVADKITELELASAAYNNELGDQTEGTGAARSESAYFAFSGTPNEARGGTMYEFEKVGAITVTIAKNETAPVG